MNDNPLKENETVTDDKPIAEMVPKRQFGPWTAFVDEGWGKIIIAREQMPDGYNDVAAELDFYGEDGADVDGPSAYEMDRARLIAAAPDLLAALVGLMRPHGGTAGVGSDHPAAIAARAAIARATGDAV